MLKKSTLGILFATVLAVPAYAADSVGFYIGGQYNQHTLEFEDIDLNLATLGILGGYQINEHFSVEGRLNLSAKDKSFDDSGNSVKFKVDNSYSAFVKGAYPFTDTFSIYALAGFNSSKYKATVNFGGPTASESESKSGFAYGAGLQFRVNDAWSVSGEYVVLPDLEDIDATNLSLVVRYKF